MDQSNQMPMQEVPSKSAGPLIGIIIIVIVLVIGALYFWGSKMNSENSPATPSAPLSQSDELSDINADLSATVINSNGSDLQAAEGAVNQ